MEPSRQSVFNRINEYDKSGDSRSFINEYASGRGSRTRYLSYHGRCYPTKAIWASSHEPPIDPVDFSTSQAEAGLKKLGFTEFVNSVIALTYFEDESIQREATILVRSASLVNTKKSKSPLVCEVCDFDFEKRYGELGAGYIECHHIDPLSKRNGINMPTTLDDLALLCASCHRMIHRTREGLTLEELKIGIENTR